MIIVGNIAQLFRFIYILGIQISTFGVIDKAKFGKELRRIYFNTCSFICLYLVFSVADQAVLKWKNIVSVCIFISILWQKNL